MPVEKVNSKKASVLHENASQTTNPVKKNSGNTVFSAKPKVFPEDFAVSKVKTKSDVCNITGFSEDYISELVKNEGLETSAYIDDAGINTIGFGHNIDADSTYNMGQKITEEQAYRLLAKDLIKAKSDLKKYIGGVKLQKKQEQALVDVVYNVGIQKVANTRLINYVKNKQFEKAVDEFDFIKINGKVSPGLIKRRLKNIKSFCGGKLTEANKKSINKLVMKGVEAYDEKIAKSGFFKRVYYRIKKFFYVKSIDRFVEKLYKKAE